MAQKRKITCKRRFAACALQVSNVRDDLAQRASELGDAHNALAHQLAYQRVAALITRALITRQPVDRATERSCEYPWADWKRRICAEKRNIKNAFASDWYAIGGNDDEVAQLDTRGQVRDRGGIDVGHLQQTLCALWIHAREHAVETLGMARVHQCAAELLRSSPCPKHSRLPSAQRPATPLLARRVVSADRFAPYAVERQAAGPTSALSSKVSAKRSHARRCYHAAASHLRRARDTRMIRSRATRQRRTVTKYQIPAHDRS